MFLTWNCVTQVSSLWRSIAFLTFFFKLPQVFMYISKSSWILYQQHQKKQVGVNLHDISITHYSYNYIILILIGCKYITIVQSNHPVRTSRSAYSNGCTTDQSSHSCLLFVIYRSIGTTSYKTVCYIKNFISPSSLKWRWMLLKYYFKCKTVLSTHNDNVKICWFKLR